MKCAFNNIVIGSIYYTHLLHTLLHMRKLHKNSYLSHDFQAKNCDLKKKNLFRDTCIKQVFP